MLQTSNIRPYGLLSLVSLVTEHSIVPVSTECQHLFPAKVVSRLARWTMMRYEDFLVRLFEGAKVQCRTEAKFFFFNDYLYSGITRSQETVCMYVYV